MPTRAADPVDALLACRPGRVGTGRTRTAALCAALGHPQRALDAVHVTGTNGKTSTAWFSAALLRAAGRRTGSFTSPHLVDLTERIRIDGEPISTAALRRRLADVGRHVAALDAAGHGLGFFDVLTALAFTELTAARVDVAVVEVGRGGRDDATNVLDAGVVVLGPVGLDHAELGRTPVEVTRNKLGLLRPGATLVTAPQVADVQHVVRQTARELGVRVVTVGRDVVVTRTQPSCEGQRVTLRTQTAEHVVDLAAHGAHQAENLALALGAAEAWHEGPLPADAVATGASLARVPGRLEAITRPGTATLLLDGAHNPAATRRLADALPSVLAGRRCVAVVGCAADKDVTGVVASLDTVVGPVVATRVPGGRSADPALVAAVTTSGTVVDDPHDAVECAARAAGPDGVVLVTGSLHLVGAVRAATGADGER